VLEALRAYVTAYEAGATPAPISNVTITPHKNAAGSTTAYFLELRANLPRPPGAQGGNNNADGARAPRARSGAPGGGTPGGGAPGGGGPPGMPGGIPGAEGAPGGEVVAQPNPQGGQGAQVDPAVRRAFQAYAALPEVRAYRGFTGCSYVTLMSASDAKAKGIVPENGRPGMYYVPGTGLVFVQALQLPQGGGSLKQQGK
jgi:hypothetical protein